MSFKVLLRLLSVFLYTTLLFFLADTLSLAYFEVENYFSADKSILYYPLHFLTSIFGQSDVVLRAFMIVVHLVSIYFFYQLAKEYLPREKDRLWSLILFILLPSVVSSAIIVHPSGLTMLFLLFFIYAFQRYQNRALWMLPLYLFIDISFFILFFGLFIYYISRKEWLVAVFQLLLMLASVMLFGFLSHGFPANYFMQMFGVTSLLFSPLLFVYYLYTLFRVGFKGNKDLVWTLSVSAFLFMLVLSMRQRVTVEHFAPYLILLLPLMVKQFMHAYRIRIRRLRKSYKILFSIALLFLVLNSLTVYFNRYFYHFIDEPKKHFLYKHYVVKELAEALHDKGHTKLEISDPYLSKRLEFYGVTRTESEYILIENSCSNVTISYDNVKISSFCVTKMNTNGNK
jgi:hypothetical protein